MDVEGNHFVIAYCLIENKQLESREVTNLNSSSKQVSPSFPAGNKKTPPVVAKPSPLPKAKVHDKPRKDTPRIVQLSGGVK
jgi:hypothetical protein